ncbi:hypothetical protein FB451DRAFT_1411775 [Mycena latifolia]|nr:hypothetical protein FB451DRAFT_1411775 [Mycena latifolia]
MLCAASLSVSTVQQPAGSAPAHIVSAATNGPQCAHCGWRGGSHDAPSSNSLHSARAMLAIFSPILRSFPASILP